ncbi:MAG: NADH-quinone oxidoreductase subunit H [Proteobacteria bacterium]|nr:NADH-quinone oxidoreductase subunit H [Pseudomonadota bacterium]
MEAQAGLMIMYGIVNAAMVLLLAPFFEGVLRKVTAQVQSRKGPPVLQPYYDLLKLLGKEDIEVGENPAMQRFAAYLSLASILTVATLVPMGSSAPMNGAGDTVLLIYLLTLCGISTLFARLAAGSLYSLVGMSREMMAMMTLEPLLAVAIVVASVHAGSLRLDAVLSGSIYGGSLSLSGIIMLGVLLFSLQGFVGRLPFDITEAETEIMEGPMIEYSGPKLALFKYVHMAKLVVYSGIFIALFIPWGNTWFYPLNIILFLIKVLALVLVVTLVAALHPRYRIDQAVRYYAGLFIISLIALICAVYGF